MARAWHRLYFKVAIRIAIRIQEYIGMLVKFSEGGYDLRTRYLSRSGSGTLDPGRDPVRENVYRLALADRMLSTDCSLVASFNGLRTYLE